MLDAVGGGFGVVHLGASATEADDVNSLPTTETKGTASASEGGAFTTLTDAVKEKFEVIQIAEATARAAAERVDEEGPLVANQATRTKKTMADGAAQKSEGLSEHTNTEAGVVNVNEDSEVPAKVKATRAKIEESNVDATEATATRVVTRTFSDGRTDDRTMAAGASVT
jgi:hypothetical protein